MPGKAVKSPRDSPKVKSVVVAKPEQRDKIAPKKEYRKGSTLIEGNSKFAEDSNPAKAVGVKIGTEDAVAIYSRSCSPKVNFRKEQSTPSGTGFTKAKPIRLATENAKIEEKEDFPSTDDSHEFDVTADTKATAMAGSPSMPSLDTEITGISHNGPHSPKWANGGLRNREKKPEELIVKKEAKEERKPPEVLKEKPVNLVLKKRAVKKLFAVSSNVVHSTMALMATHLREERKVALDKCPRHHICMEVSNLSVFELYINIKKKSITYEHIRENMANLFALKEYIEKASPTCGQVLFL